MSYKVETITNFRKEAKKLIQKYPSLTTEIENIGIQLAENPKLGVSIGKNCFKIRLSIASKGKGKSGGARIITYVFVSNATVYLLSIYDKSEKSNISNSELTDILKQITQ